MKWAHWWKWAARLYRKRYLRVLQESADGWNEVALWRIEHERLKRASKDLLEILDSGHIRACESIARTHGYELDEQTSLAYGNKIQNARELLEGGMANAPDKETG